MNGAQLLGPLVGGAIYQAGGFYLPFVTMGSLQVLVGFISIFCLHEPNYGSKWFLVSVFSTKEVHSEDDLIPLSAKDPEKTDDEDRDKMKTISIMQILAIPTIWFSFATFIVATACNGFLSINLEPKVNAMYSLRKSVKMAQEEASV